MNYLYIAASTVYKNQSKIGFSNTAIELPYTCFIELPAKIAIKAEGHFHLQTLQRFDAVLLMPVLQ